MLSGRTEGNDPLWMARDGDCPLAVERLVVKLPKIQKKYLKAHSVLKAREAFIFSDNEEPTCYCWQQNLLRRCRNYSDSAPKIIHHLKGLNAARSLVFWLKEEVGKEFEGNYAC